MASDAVRKVQDKLFRGANAGGPGDGSPSQEREPGLTINIPNPILTDPTQNGPLPKMAKTETNTTNLSENDDERPFRVRLAEQLGPDYQGTERFRLEQDDKRERHWKRWGPYLSDRQWVR